MITISTVPVEGSPSKKSRTRKDKMMTHSEFKKVDNQDLAYYLRITPGLHNWQVPRGIGFTDSRGVCRAFVAYRPEGTVCYLNVQDYRKYAAINYESYKLQKEMKKKR